MNSTNDALSYRVTEWCFGVLSLLPPLLFIGVFGRSDWTRPEVTVFIGFVVWAVVVGFAVGLIRRSTPRRRILLALACPFLAAALAVLLGCIYEVSRSQFPMTAILGWACYYAVMLTILSSPAIAAFFVAHGLKMRCHTGDPS